MLSPRVRDALGRHLVVWLQVDAEEAWRRIEGGERPLARPAEDDAALLQAATPLRGASGHRHPRRAQPDRARAATHPRALAAAARDADAVGGERGRRVPGVRRRGAAGPDWWPLESRRFCVTDRDVGELYAELIEPLEARIEVDPGEGAKTLASAERVLEQLTEAGMTRADHLVALGGGVVGDLGGFCAHTYQRGVPVVQVPTTVVAQVDSAYGGKTGVDLPQGKNYVGAYHLPAAVIADWATIATLPPAELAAGFVEVLKTGLLAGGDLWEGVRAIGAGELAAQSWVAFACARYKCEVVAADERDAGLRQVLNLGHTVGHAIEAASGYRRYRHGEAIGLGLLATLRLSGAPDLRHEVAAWLGRHGLPAGLDRSVGIERGAGGDRARQEADLRRGPLVLLEHPGLPRTGQVLEPDKVEAAIEELYE